MQQRWRRYRPVVGVSAVALIVVAVYVAVDHLTRERPNYSQVEDGLYLGGRVPAPPPGTRAVLNLCRVEDPYQAEVHRWVPIPDAEPAPALDWLRQQVEFIDAQRRAGLPVYVHCRAGVSRAGLVTVAYLMWRESWSRDEALRFVRSKRPHVRPNPAFMCLLLEWEQSLARAGG
jgi:protein-tyrosine phosphatase